MKKITENKFIELFVQYFKDEASAKRLYQKIWNHSLNGPAKIMNENEYVCSVIMQEGELYFCTDKMKEE